ncbi:hypothetical protein MSAR_34790 [Mycolicibacterium sarraceniae]|uniref:Uncharacterized protein n=1 Tax=Mycolicibacterium sarraceniae TaxID=1534348 RepID=A0A7I7SUH2_9MYCO|nr:hypothetical protein MSAR_34790 [Mycolicibacterium sarraceniae]
MSSTTETSAKPDTSAKADDSTSAPNEAGKTAKALRHQVFATYFANDGNDKSNSVSTSKHPHKSASGGYSGHERQRLRVLLTPWGGTRCLGHAAAIRGIRGGRRMPR